MRRVGTVWHRFDTDTSIVAVQQMSEQIEQLVKESFADQYFEKALNCLKVLREECKKVRFSSIRRSI